MSVQEVPPIVTRVISDRHNNGKMVRVTIRPIPICGDPD